jgi:2-haloacid dehalogenase
MSKTRRDVLALGAASLVVGATTVGATGEIAGRHNIKAIAFDAFPVFDPRPTFLLAEELFPGRGAELGNMWRTRQFEYTWLRAVSQRYADFWQVTTDALVFSAKALRLELPDEKRARLMQLYIELKPWPDAVDALGSLKDAGLRLVFLSNFTPGMLQAAVKSSGLEGMFEHLISTDVARTYKPDPRAYRLAIDALKLRREEILFVAFGGWDAVGAKSFGYTTFWVNRQNLPAEELGVAPDATGGTLGDLVDFLKV